MNKKWKYCGSASVLIEADLNYTPKSKAYEDKFNKHKKLYYFVCDELSDDVFGVILNNMLILVFSFHQLDKNYKKRDQCIRKHCSYLMRVDKDYEKIGMEGCFQKLQLKETAKINLNQEEKYE